MSGLSPLAPASFPAVPPVTGARFATVCAGVKNTSRPDVMLALLDPGTCMAGVFTRSSTRSAAVHDCEAKMATPGDMTQGAAILVNSGNSNAFTGQAGQDSVDAICTGVARKTGVPMGRVFTSSTGVIGVPLPHERILGKLPDLHSALDSDGIAGAARAIMTTDTYAKGASAQVQIEGKTVTISGIAKGSGMIAPDMATMLVYIFTDAALTPQGAQNLLRRLSDRTFNCITVDGDTSTSDTLLMAATGASGVQADTDPTFESALHQVMLDLAHQVVRDGEGATKFVTVRITGAADEADARKVAFSIANSPLVKTAIAGEDPNWGRIVMAVGKSGAQADRDRLEIRFGDILVAKDGWVWPEYHEPDAAAYMKGQEITLSVDMGLGQGQATVWTCDLTHAYIQINADYRS